MMVDASDSELGDTKKDVLPEQPDSMFCQMSAFRNKFRGVIMDTIVEEDFRNLLLEFIRKAKGGDTKAMAVLLDFLML